MPLASFILGQLVNATSHSRAFLPRGGVSLPGRIVAVLAVAGMLSIPAHAQQPSVVTTSQADTLTLSLSEVQQLALTRNPASLAEREEIAIAEAGLRRARTIPSNPDASIQGAGTGGTTEATVTQEIEVLGQRGLRIGAARLGITRAGALASNAGRLAVAEASSAFVRAIAAERRGAVTREAFALVERLLSAVRIQLKEGEVSRMEANLAEIELGRARARVLASQRLANTTLLDLKRLAGLPPETPVRLVYDSVGPVVSAAGVPRELFSDTVPLAADRLLAMALDRRSDLAARETAVRELDALTRLARREALPNLRLGAVIESSGGSRSIGPVIGLSLPLFNRNQGLIAEREAQRRQAALLQRATELRVRTDVATAIRSYQTATAEAVVFEQSVRQPSHENAALLETAFRAGKIPLPTLLLLRNQLLESELGYWDAWLARQEALVQLQAATGTLPTFPLSSDSTASAFR